MIAEVLEIEQRTEAWYDARLGRATASQFKDILAKVGKGEAAGRRNYRAALVVERLTGHTPERFSSKAMEWGTSTEDLARTEYMLATGNLAEEVGIFLHPTLMAAASPDGKVTEQGGALGGLEIKCYNTANHILALRTGEMPKEHMPQVQGQMWLSGWAWVDFVSFDPDLPENAQLFIQRIYRDDAYIANLEMHVKKFLQEVNEEVGFVSNYKRS